MTLDNTLFRLKRGYLSLSMTDILSQIISVAGGCFVFSRMFNVISHLYPGDDSSRPPTATNKNICKQMFPQTRNTGLKNMGLPDTGKEEVKIMSFWLTTSGLYLFLPSTK